MSKFKDDECFIETHTSVMILLQQCNGTAVTYFEDLAKNHNKTIIRVEDLQLAYLVPTQNAQPQPMPVSATFIIDTRDGKTIKRTIPVSAEPVDRTFQVEDVCRVSVRCECGGVSIPPFIAFDLRIDKTFCICCPDDGHDKHEKHHCDRCGSHDECSCSKESYYHSYYAGI